MRRSCWMRRISVSHSADAALRPNWKAARPSAESWASAPARARRHALLFAARELIGIALLSVPEADHRQTFRAPSKQRASPGQSANAQTVSNVLKNRHVWEKRIVLKDKSHVALIGRQLSNVGAVHNLPRRRYFKPGDHSERGGLAAARRPRNVRNFSGLTVRFTLSTAKKDSLSLIYLRQMPRSSSEMDMIR